MKIDETSKKSALRSLAQSLSNQLVSSLLAQDLEAQARSMYGMTISMEHLTPVLWSAFTELTVTGPA